MLAATIWAAAAIALTECLSLAGQINVAAVTVAWLLVAGVTAVLYLRSRRREVMSPIRLLDRTRFGRVIAGGIFAVLAATLATALLTPPNIWDVIALSRSLACSAHVR